MYNVTRKKSEIRICERLSNGKLLNLYFYRKRDDIRFVRWYVGLYISDTRKEANRWFTTHSKHKKSMITGDGSLVGLRRSLKYILEFSKRLGMYEELIIEWEDEKRKSTYRYLKRYGFVDYFDDDKNVTGYGIRNLNYWEYKNN